jgi:hypothetical protein
LIKFLSQRFGQSRDSKFARRVHVEQGNIRYEVPRNAVHVDDVAVDFFRFHDFHRLSGRDAQTHDVGVEGFLPFLCVSIPEGRFFSDYGTLD